MTILLLCLSLFVSDCFSSNSWRGLTPLATNREQVEKVFGKPLPHSVNPYAGRYETGDGEVSILYSRGNCDSKDNSGWDVDALTIIEIKFYPKSPPPLAKLRIDLSKFEKSEDRSVIGVDEYSNYQNGVALTVNRDGSAVTSFRYFPDRLDKRERCKVTR